MEDTAKYFGVLDLVVFAALLSVSSFIGAYFAYKDRNDKSTENYYFGDRELSSGPVAMSMAVSFISALTVIGFPVEIYLHGTVFFWVVPAVCVSAILPAIYYIPLIYRLKLDTIYEYLELRFNKYVRQMVSGIVIVEMIIYMGITVYLPALALEAVTPLGLSLSIILTSIVCTFYTAIGGIKAVIWTDVLQGFVMMFGSLALFIKTIVLLGGFGNMVAAVQRGGRNTFFDTDLDIRTRSSPLSIMVGYSLLATTGACSSQVYCQRYLSCKSESAAKKASIYRIIPSAICLLLAFSCGLAMYAYFEGCDPTDAGILTKRDQTTPRLAIEVFQDMPGMAGLFVSAAYSGTLSTVSSGVNALSAMSAEDFVKARWPKIGFSTLTVISKGFSIFYGVMVMAMAFLISTMKSTVIQISASFAGILGGSIFSVFTMGIFIPWTNTIGAICGLIVGWIVTGWVAISAILIEPAEEFRENLPLSIEECNFTWTGNVTNELNITWAGNLTNEVTVSTADYAISTEARHPLGDTLFSISPYLYGLLGLTAACTTMLLVSVITGMNKASEMNPDLFLPILDNKRIFPRNVIKFFRLGVPERDEFKQVEVEDLDDIAKKTSV